MSVVKKIKSDNLSLANMVFEPFLEVMMNGCPSHAVYRGELFSDGAGGIRCEIIATNINGSFRKLYVVYDLQRGIIFHSREFIFDSEKGVQEAMRNLIDAIDKQFPWDINRLFFDFSKRFCVGIVESLQCTEEKNLYLVGSNNVYSLLRSDNDDKRFLIGEICDPWGSHEWVLAKNGHTEQ